MENFPFQNIPNLPRSEAISRSEVKIGWACLEWVLLARLPVHQTFMLMQRGPNHTIMPPSEVARHARSAGLRFKACDENGNEIEGKEVDDKLAADMFAAVHAKSMPDFAAKFQADLPKTRELLRAAGAKIPTPKQERDVKIGIVIYPDSAFQ